MDPSNVLPDRPGLEDPSIDPIIPQQSHHEPKLEPQATAGAEDARSPEPELERIAQLPGWLKIIFYIAVAQGQWAILYYFILHDRFSPK